jgi:small subunit ribosomal protein S16
MSLVIRLSRIGRKGEAKYRVVVKEKRSKRDGSSIDLLGFIEKKVGKNIVKVDIEKLKQWKMKGAKMSPSLEKVLA